MKIIKILEIMPEAPYYSPWPIPVITFHMIESYFFSHIHVIYIMLLRKFGFVELLLVTKIHCKTCTRTVKK